MLKVTATSKNDALNCPYRDVIDRIGDKWSLLILTVLEEKPTRFNELRRTIGDISQKVLTKTLRNLESDGFVIRTVYDESPPKVVYKISPLGSGLLQPIDQLVAWANDNHEKIKANREEYKNSNKHIKSD
ncbi:transcriptional regulator [Thalassotalea euphylliae]|uniref:Transcriptional regulator n=1 Tax=Thalassotalea euphylliae TaxID=1655234 RepID=A0A3E0TQH7_9GAMM|nr:helix-turn-helix domain-containing protein [Thalassotalea euphylliae]REL26789.1 transcriptional regulator [Thalassotalea euphylliae]